ncbi:Quiannulatene synthase [Cladobotryum mycophilum]|uniref:Quiannulatene synthase n=1 Tax=Cladobotryum mycophilum TaxID=491253 RepID=A0ABR0SMU4_9HYPO
MPPESEYLNVVDNKTGGMFQLLVQLLKIESATTLIPSLELDLGHLILLLGRFFQIRDDFMNLQSAEYSNQKGFCEDLDEGKFSYPIIHLLGHAPEYKDYITGIFRQLPVRIGQPSGLSRETKMSILEILQESGSLKATLHYLQQLETDIEDAITKIEDSSTGEKNATMRLVIAMLSVKDM